MKVSGGASFSSTPGTYAEVALKVFCASSYLFLAAIVHSLLFWAFFEGLGMFSSMKTARLLQGNVVYPPTHDKGRLIAKSCEKPKSLGSD